MKVILKQRVDKIGQTGEVVNVKDGFARNFLLPNGLALEANKANMNAVSALKASMAALEEKQKQEFQELADKLGKASWTLSAEANEEDKLYGSVDSIAIARLLKDEGYEVDKNNIILAEAIKSLGAYEVELKLHPQVTAKIKVWIVKK